MSEATFVKRMGIGKKWTLKELDMQILDTRSELIHTAAAATILAFAAYVAIFAGIVSKNSDQDCTLKWVDFPKGHVRTVFRPLISLHKLLDQKVLYTGKLDETRSDYCGE